MKKLMDSSIKLMNSMWGMQGKGGSCGKGNEARTQGAVCDRRSIGAHRAPLQPLNPSAEPVPEQADEFVNSLAIGFNGSPRWQEVFEGEIHVVKAEWSGHNRQPLFPETGLSAEHAPRVSNQGNS